MPVFGGAGVGLTLKGGTTNLVTLAAGEVWYPNNQTNPSVPGQGVGKAGWFYTKPGRYTSIQTLDPITGIWRGIGDDSNGERYFYSDGVNVRLANQSGCPIGAVVTTAGSAYTTTPTIVASAGGSKWVAVMGPNVSSTVTVTYGGTNYVYPPICIIDAPPAGGIQATAYATLSGTSVSSVTIQNQGGGYSGGTPNITLVNDSRDTTGAGATAVLTLANSQTVVGALVLDHGSPITSGTIPTLTFGSGSAAATVLMNWGVQTYSVTTAGAGYGNSGFISASWVGPAPPTAAANTAGIDIGLSLVRQRMAEIWVATNSTGGLTATGGVTIDGGVYYGIPSQAVVRQPLAVATTVGVLGVTMGGFTDTSFVQAF